MGSPSAGEPVRRNPEAELGASVARYFPWLGWLIAGRKEKGRYTVDGVSLRRRADGWMVVATAYDLEEFRPVVAFGRAESLYYALRNCTSSIAKGEWKRDKFREEAKLGDVSHRV